MSMIGICKAFDPPTLNDCVRPLGHTGNHLTSDGVSWGPFKVEVAAETALNPKTLMGQRKVPNLSVIPPAAILYMGTAMRYGAHEAPRADGGTGYGPYNWRDQPVEASTYVDAAIRHLMEFWDGQDVDPKSLCHHLGHALATIGILVDALENETCKDDRPAVRKQAASAILARETKSFNTGEKA